MPFTEDHTAFLDTDDFATAVTVGGVSVNAIFDAEYVEVGFDGVSVESVWPVLHCDETDAAVAAAVQGTTAVVNSVNYTVAEVRPDGTGMTILRLRAT